DLLSARSFVNGLHQGIRWKFTWITNDRSAAYLPITRRERRRIERCWWNAAWVWRVGVGWHVCGRAQLFQKRFSQALRERLMQFLLGALRLGLFFLAPGFRLLLLRGLGSCFLPGPQRGICHGPFFFSQRFLAFI